MDVLFVIWSTSFLASLCLKRLLSHFYPGAGMDRTHVYFLYDFHRDESEQLKLGFEIIFVFLALFFTLVGVIVWKTQRMQTPKARTLVFLTPCFTLKLQFEIITLWRCYCSQSSGVIIWNTQRIQTANKLLLCIPWCRVVCVCASPEHILFLCLPLGWTGSPETSIWKKKTKRISHTMYYSSWSDHLEISTHTNSQNSHSCISHTMFHTCWSDRIIWKSQRIQTPKIRTLVHTLPEYKFTLPIMKLFSCPKSKQFT